MQTSTVIAGGGASGILAAIVCARKGDDVVLLEKTTVSAKSCFQQETASAISRISIVLPTITIRLSSKTLSTDILLKK